MNARGTRTFTTLAFIAVLAILATVYCSRTPRELTPQERNGIADAVEQNARGRIRSVRPERCGVVVVFVGEDNQLGGQEFKLEKRGGKWTTVSRTVYF